MTYTVEELREILRKHAAWLVDGEGGEQADLRGADLREANAPEDLTPGECNEATLALLGKAALGDEWPKQVQAVCEKAGKERLTQLDQKSIDALIARLEKRLAEQKSGEKQAA